MSERYCQDRLPGISSRRNNKEFVCVFTDEVRKITSAQLRQIADEEIIQKEHMIPRKNVLFYDEEIFYKDKHPKMRRRAVVKIKSGDEERISGFIFRNEPVIDHRNRKNNRSDDTVWYPRYFLTNYWAEQSEMIFPPWSLKDLEPIENKDLPTASINEVGGKGFGIIHDLVENTDIGYEVPPFFVIPTSFYDVLDSYGFEGRAEEIMKNYNSPEEIIRKSRASDGEVMRSIIPKKIEDLFDSLNVYENIFEPYILPGIKRLAENYDNLSNVNSLIFRSSSILEDSSEHLCQGVFESYQANVSHDDRWNMIDDEEAYDAYKRVFLSSWTTYAESFFRSRGFVDKGLRKMPIIVQIVPNDAKFTGRAFIDGDNVEIEYADFNVQSGNYVGNRIYIENGKVVKRIDDVKDYGLRAKSREGELLMDDSLGLKIADIAKKLSGRLTKFGGKLNIEFGASKAGKIYLYQDRPTIRESSNKNLPNLDEIERGRILQECTEYWNTFSVGKVTGPVVNLLKYRTGWDPNLPRKEFLDELSEMDSKYSGYILIVPFFHPSIEDIYMLTPHKSAIVVCWGHDTFDRCDHFAESLYQDPTFHIMNVLPELFSKFDTGMRVSIVSNGQKAIFYKPYEHEKDTISFYSAPDLNKDKFTYFDKCVQEELPYKKQV